MLVRVQLSESLIKYFRKIGVDLIICDSHGKTSSLDYNFLGGDVFDMLVACFNDRDLIGAPDPEGMTSLSHSITSNSDIVKIPDITSARHVSKWLYWSATSWRYFLSRDG